VRYVDLTIRPERGWFHRFDEVLAEESAVREEAIHQVYRLEDGSAVVLSGYSGDTGRLREIATADFDHAIAWQLFETGDDTLLSAHIEPSDIVHGLLEIPQRYGVLVDFPPVFRRDGAIGVTVVGEEDDIRDAIPEIPGGVRANVERTDEYQPQLQRLFTESPPASRGYSRRPSRWTTTRSHARPPTRTSRPNSTVRRPPSANTSAT
jgi:hypothetical protein